MSNESEPTDLTKLVLTQMPGRSCLDATNPHKLVAMTNCESMSEIFPNWVQRAYLGPSPTKCSYRPFDLNMPTSILRRNRIAHSVDSPLTEFGKVCATIRARQLIQAKIIPGQIFCSHELRSAETACEIAKVFAADGYQDIPIFIDVSLSEWRNFDESQTEKYWLTVKEFRQIGYHHVHENYLPVRVVADLPTSETPQQYLDRLVEFLASVVQNYKDCSMLIGSSALLSLMSGAWWKSGNDLQRIRNEFTSSSMAIHCVPGCKSEAEKCCHSILPFTHCLDEAERKK